MHRRRAAGAGVAFLLGIGALVAGMQFGWVLSVAGFVVMFGATIVALSSWQRVGAAERVTHEAGDHDFLDRMEEKWRRHQDDGL